MEVDDSGLVDSLRGRLITIIIGGISESRSGGSERPSILRVAGGFVFACFLRAPPRRSGEQGESLSSSLF